MFANKPVSHPSNTARVQRQSTLPWYDLILKLQCSSPWNKNLEESNFSTIGNMLYKDPFIVSLKYQKLQMQKKTSRDNLIWSDEIFSIFPFNRRGAIDVAPHRGQHLLHFFVTSSRQRLTNAIAKSLLKLALLPSQCTLPYSNLPARDSNFTPSFEMIQRRCFSRSASRVIFFAVHSHRVLWVEKHSLSARFGFLRDHEASCLFVVAFITS